ncbi:MAG TPA: hypothetical protein VHA12_03325 [Candidatus Nanoarchaeia archaeon]|nr:hypothetical protein [Candidatus Nanoarchaeia archaeon]
MSIKTWYKERKFYFIFSVSLLAIAIYLFLDSSFLVRSFATVIFLAIFYIGDRMYSIQFKDKHYLFFIVLIVMGVLASPLYFLYPQYDKVQHFVMPILMSSMAYYMVNKLPLEKKWKIWYTFYIVVALIGIFELAEYSIDRIFDFKLQGVYLRDISGLSKLNTIQGPLDDTMMDMFLGTLGASIYGIYKNARKER